MRVTQETAPSGLFLDVARKGIEHPHGPHRSAANGEFGEQSLVEESVASVRRGNS